MKVMTKQSRCILMKLIRTGDPHRATSVQHSIIATCCSVIIIFYMLVSCAGMFHLVLLYQLYDQPWEDNSLLQRGQREQCKDI